MTEHATPTLKPRDRWSGRSAFVLAAIGSAVGLGNLWGFPYKLYEGGGGAFLIPYFIALIALGLPLMIAEFALGHRSQQSPPNTFARIAQQYRFVGWWLIALAFVIVTYYTVVLAYCVLLLVDSVQGMLGEALPWAGSTDAASTYFFSDLLAHDGNSMALAGLQWPIVAGLAVSWLLIYLSLFRGVKWVSKVVLLTVPLPWLMLLVLTVRGLTLDGAVDGLKFYLEPDFSRLLDVNTWRLAFGQVFFTLSLGFGVMLSYASFLHRRSDLNNNAMIIGLSDLATSFIAGLAVFATLGAMAVATNVQVTEVVSEGVGLAFVTFPYALAQLPAWQAFFSAVFFIALLTLGIDSAFSIVEACLATLDDNTRWRRSVILPCICVTGFVIGLIYTGTGGGLNWLGLVDSLVFGPVGIMVAALAQCLVVGWALDRKLSRTLRDHANDHSDWRLGYWWEWTIRYLAPALLVALFVWSLSDTVLNGNAYQWAGTALFIAMPVGLYLFAKGPRREQMPSDRPGARKLAGVLLVAVVLGLGVGAARVALAPDIIQLRNGDQLTGHIVERAADGSVVFEHATLGRLTLTAEQLQQDEAEAAAEEVGDASEPVVVALANGDSLTVHGLDFTPHRYGNITLVHDVLGELKIDRALVTDFEGLVIQLENPNAPPAPIERAELGTSAYVVLAVAFLVIFGGLAWCFWRALGAAGGQDEEIQDEPSI